MAVGTVGAATSLGRERSPAPMASSTPRPMSTWGALVVAEERQMAGTAAGRPPGATGTMRPSAERAARASRPGIAAPLERRLRLLDGADVAGRRRPAGRCGPSPAARGGRGGGNDSCHERGGSSAPTKAPNSCRGGLVSAFRAPDRRWRGPEPRPRLEAAATRLKARAPPGSAARSSRQSCRRRRRAARRLESRRSWSDCSSSGSKKARSST